MSSENIAAIYVRVSTEKEEQRLSPENQRKICEVEAESKGLKVEYYYEDRSTGTSITEREDMQLLLEDAKKGYFKTVIFASLSRFSRDLTDSLNMKRILVDALGIRLISVDENFDSLVDKDSNKFELHQLINENYAKQISNASRRGIKARAMQGNFTGSFAPYGYRKVIKDGKKTLEINKDEAAIVRLIYHWYVHNGMGEKAIVNALNEQNIPSPRGGLWGVTTIQRILQNEAYTGRNVYSKYAVQFIYDLNNPTNRRKRLVQKSKDEWMRNEGKDWEAIIDEDTFQKAQEIRQVRGGGTRGGVRNVKVNPFSGLIKCKHCGSSFVSMLSGKRGKKGQQYRYLICSSRRRMGAAACENDLWIPLEEFRNSLLAHITEQLKKWIDVENITENLTIPASNKEKDAEKEIEKVERKLLNTRRHLFELRKEFKNGDVSKEQYEFEKVEYEKEIEALEKRLNKLKKIKEQKHDDELVKRRIKNALNDLANLNYENVAELQLVLKQIVDEITVDKHGNTEIFTPLGTLT
ncbi:recombinase family protein [Geobacillus sp. WSUCF-018B]|uniref:recombinase family protein n=1 Tax=Geobacillus sp. WSUCF-018B TaxID=2055939 RepID=UPI000C28D3D4|nr:recombinase family protein [Geobacillus sp. WSUCF-018B]